MTPWDVRTFEEQANKIVGAWSSTLDQNGASLGVLVEKTARDHSLNPEQIRRLSRIVNSRAFNARFEQMGKQAQASDRFVDFDVVREDDVIAALHKTAAVSTKVAAEKPTYPSLKNEMASVRGEDREVFSKTAFDHQQNERTIDLHVGREPSKLQTLMHYQKLAGELRGKIAFEGHKYRESMEALRKESSYIGFNHDKFERDALAVCGPDALDVLNTLRSYRKIAELRIPTEKVAELLDRLVGEETKQTKLVFAAISSYEAFNQSKMAAEELDRRVASLKVELFQ